MPSKLPDPTDCSTRLPFTQVSGSTGFFGSYDAVGSVFLTVDLVVMFSLLELPMSSFGTFISLSTSMNGLSTSHLIVNQICNVTVCYCLGTTLVRRRSKVVFRFA